MIEIGTVISTPEGPSTSSFSFVVNTKNPIRKGQYIQIETDEGILISRVAEITKTNKYYSQAETVKEYEKDGRKMNDVFPAENWEYLTGNAVPLGIFSEGMHVRMGFPPSPGQKVFSADEKILSDFLGFDKNGIFLGNLAFHNVDVKLNITKFFQKHAAILAMSGAGKSHLASVIIEELLEKSLPAVIVFDPHGEYSGFANDEKFVGRTKIFDKNNISIAANKLSANMLSELIAELSPVQKRELNNLLKELREKNPAFDFDELLKYIESSEINEKTKETLASWLLEISSTGLFSAADSPSVEELARAGQLSVFDLSDFVSQKERQIILTTFARKLFNARREKKIPPFILFVEEAHQFCLSEDTEMLTKHGWRKYNEIKIGDLIFAYDKNSGKLATCPIERKIIRNHRGKLIRLRNEDSINSLVTVDHRVLCYTRTTAKTRKWKWSNPKFILARDLPSGAKIPVTAEMISNEKFPIDNNLIKILGWIITDGNLHFTNNKKYFSYVISQSKSKGRILEEMKKTIKKRFPESTIYSRKRRHGFYNNIHFTKTEEFRFYLGKNATEEVFKWLGYEPHKIPRRLIENCSLGQLKILFNSLIQGDGSMSFSKNKQRYVTFYPGHDSDLADDFQELCVRLGFSAVKKKSSNNQLKVLVSFKRKFAYVKKIEEEYYSGRVWDITVKHGAFIARRDGKVFITGNCPQDVERSLAISRNVVEQIAREGRKFNSCLVLISQRPVNLSTTALSQCNTHIILRVTNPYDLDHIQQSSEGLTSDVINTIPGLKVGEAYVVGEAVNFPILMKIRDRKSKKSGKGMRLEDELQEFSNQTISRKEDVKAFL